MELENRLLRRFWFKTKKGLGIGVTAYSLDDAKTIVSKATEEIGKMTEIVAIVEDIDITTLDQNHIIPNMGPPNLRGVWYPRLNI